MGEGTPRQRELGGSQRGHKRQSLSLAKIDYSSTRVQPIPEDVLRENRLVAGFIREGLADTYRILRAQVLQRLDAMQGNTLAICSPNAGAGKTLTAANLAISLAMDPNQTVLLVDLDLRRASVGRCFGLKNEFGLCDYLEGSAEISDCLISPGIERLVVLPVRRAVLNSSELLSSPRMVGLAEELATRYPDRLVLYDLPPLLASDDCLVTLPLVDAALLVVKEGETRVGEIQRCLRLLEDTNLIGTVLNECQEANPYPYY